MTDLVVLGSLNMDLVVRAERMPRPGETIRGTEFRTVPGGKGANQAAAAARMGAKVEMIGRVGRDSFGPVLLENLRSQRVGVSHVALDSGIPTGTATIIVDDRGENTIIVVAGANGRVTTEDVNAAEGLLRQARYLVMQCEIPLPTVRAAISRAVELGLQVILNAAPACPLSPGFLEGVYCLVVNELEAESLTGIKVTDLVTARGAAEHLLAWPSPVVIITLGADGALLATKSQVVHAPARKVKVVDTTAAGDAFIGGLTVALLRGFELVEAVRYATCAGTLATTVLGAQTSLPSGVEVEAFYRDELS